MQEKQVTAAVSRDSSVESVLRFMGAVDGAGLTGALVGCGNGAAALLMLSTGRVAKLYCIDAWDGQYQASGGTGDRSAKSGFEAVTAASGDSVVVLKSLAALSEHVGGSDSAGRLDFVYLSPAVSERRAADDLDAAVRLQPGVVGGRGYSQDNKSVCGVVNRRFGRPDRMFTDSTWMVYSPGARIPRVKPSSGVGRLAVPGRQPLGRPLGKCADAAFVVCFTGTPERAAAHKADSERVGLSVEQVWQFPTPFDKYFSDSVPHTGQFDERPGWANSWFGHYRAIKLAYERGCKSALIMEDDCRFMLDRAKLDEIAADVPADFDFALLDHFYCRWDADGRRNYETLRRSKVTKYWSAFSYDMYSAACYLISRKAMERLIWLHETVIDPGLKTRMMRVTDYWHNRGNLGDMNLYFCTPNCAVQRNPDASSIRLSDTTGINHNYLNMGLDLSAYAVG